MSGIRIKDWREVRKGSLLGFCEVELASGMTMADVTVLTGDHGPWASPPSKPMISKDGKVLTDDKGKVRYVPIIGFTSKEVRQRFSSGVIEAMRAAHPEVFG